MIDCDRCGGTGKVRTEKENRKVAAELRKLRERKGVSLRGMAKLLGISPGHLSRLETGKERLTPEMEKWYRAKVEGVKP